MIRIGCIFVQQADILKTDKLATTSHLIRKIKRTAHIDLIMCGSILARMLTKTEI